MVIVEVVCEEPTLQGIELGDHLPCVEVISRSRVLALEQQLDLRCQIREAVQCPQDRSIPATSYLLVSPVDPDGVIAVADGEIETPRRFGALSSSDVVLALT